VLSDWGGRRWHVGKLLRVTHDIDNANPPVGDLVRYHREWLSVVVTDGAELAIDARQSRNDIRRYKLS
jgi:hypothetical protein